MKTKTRISVVALTMAVGLLGTSTVVKSHDGSTGGPLHRLAADFDFTGETTTAVGVFPNSVGSVPGNDGTLVYRKRVSVPSDHNVLYVGVSMTGDTHDGAALWLNCRLDGSTSASDCNTGFGADGAQNGYVSLQKMPSFLVFPLGAVGTCDDGGGGFGDCHDNNINYTWCIPIVPDEWSGPISHNVEIRMATSESGKAVFFEKAHFYIDSNNIQGNACEPYNTNNPPPFPAP